MAEHKRVPHNKHEEVDQKHLLRKKDSEPLSERFDAPSDGILSMTETPFHTGMDEHAALLAMAHSDEARSNLIMHLQQTCGNRYVQRLLNSVRVQAKLTVSNPSDVYEQEADRVAKVVNKAIDTKLQRQAEEEEEAQTKPAGNKPATISEDLEAKIKAERGSGHPLSDVVREPMERAFKADFSDVRVHTDSEADALNQQISAKAFTTGQDVFFREGEYEPGSGRGQELIAPRPLPARQIVGVAQEDQRERFGQGPGPQSLQ